MFDLFGESEKPLGGDLFTGPTPGLGEVVGKGIMRGGVKVAKGAATLAAAVTPWGDEEDPQAFVKSEHVFPRKEDFFSFIEGPLDQAEKFWSVDPGTISTSGKIVSALAELPLMLATGPVGLFAPSATVGMELVKEGVDPATATLAGEANLAATALAVGLPQAGRTLKETIGLVLANPAMGAAQDYATGKLLDARGYEDQAKAFDPFDPAARSVDLVLGAVFGGIAEYGRWKAKKAPAEVQDAIDVVEGYKQQDALNPFDPAAAPAKGHREAVGRALDALDEGQPVDVAAILANAKPRRQSYTAERLRSELRDVFGSTDEQADAFLALVSARARVKGEELDTWIDRNIAGIVKGMEGDQGAALLQNRPLVQPFYSKVLAEVEGLTQEKWNGDQLLARLRKADGVKAEEIAWTGLDDFLTGKKSVTREEVRSFLEENQVRVEEKVVEILPQYEQYQLPGGKEYRELLLTLLAKAGAREYASVHYPESNILAHVRFNERTGPSGERILHLEEVQSDWAQDARKGKSVPDAPFVGSTEKWAGLALRRMLRWASEHGYDRLTWTTGEQQADRYDISRLLDEVTYRKSGDAWQIDGYREGSSRLSKKIPDADLDEAVGKELAQKIRNGEGTQRYPGTSTPDMSLKGLDLKVGGHGMRGFYDQILPTYLAKFGKKFGARVETVEVPEAGAVHSLPITDAMRDALLYDGQPLFQGEKGAVTFLADGRALIHALEAPDFSTLVHETAHIFERDLTKLERRAFDTWLHSAVPGSKWSEGQKELFARSFERYLAEGKAPAPELQGIFDKFRNWLLEIYQRITGTAIDVKLNDNVRAAFDRMLFDASLKREHPPEVTAVRAEVDRLAPEIEAEAYAMAGEDPPAADHLGGANKMVATDHPGDATAMIAEAEQALYEHPDIIKGFMERPENVAGILADFLEAEASALDQAEHGRVMVDGYQKEASWSTAPEWFLERNRSIRDSGGAMDKKSVVNALRKTAQGKFRSLTAGQQDMVTAALDSISRQVQGLTREVFAGDLQVGDRFAEPDMGLRTVVGERDGRLILDNGRTVDMAGEIQILGDVDQSGRLENEPATPADLILRERGDFAIHDGTEADGTDRMRSARELLDEARNAVEVEKNKAHLYRHAAVCLNMG